MRTEKLKLILEARIEALKKEMNIDKPDTYRGGFDTGYSLGEKHAYQKILDKLNSKKG